MKPIDVYEHGRLLIGEQGFEKSHWEAFVKLNTIHDGAYFDVLYNGLKFKEYVGVIQVDKLTVHIHPKADKDAEDSQWKGVLLEMLKACGKVKAHTADNANLKKQHVNLLEVYFDYFLREVEALIHQGLVKKYRRNTGNVKALKGKLEFSGHIRQNIVHKERFYITHQVYDVDHKIHQVLAHALSIVGQFSTATHLSDRWRRVHMAFPEVSSINPTAQLLESIVLDRKTAPYERVMELAKFIILNYSPDINKGQQKMIALLFNMNELWEEYVLKQLKRFAADHSSLKLFVHGQQSKAFHGSYRTIRPDIVVEKGNETYIIDTKWKRPYNNSASIEDLRQMYTYGRYWKASKLMLLYPGNDYDGGYEVYHGENDGMNHYCKIARVSVLNSEGLNPNLGKAIIDMMVALV